MTNFNFLSNPVAENEVNRALAAEKTLQNAGGGTSQRRTSLSAEQLSKPAVNRRSIDSLQREDRETTERQPRDNREMTERRPSDEQRSRMPYTTRWLPFIHPKYLFRHVACILMLLVLGIGQAWGGAGYYEESGKAIQLRFLKDGGTEYWANVGATQASAGDLGTIYELTLDKFYVYVWREGVGIDWSDLQYRIYKEGDTPPVDWSNYRGYWIENITGKNAKYGKDGGMNINCLAGNFVPGATYIFEYCVNSDQAGWRSNNSNNYKFKFTIANRYLAASFARNTWSTKDHPLENGSITIHRVAGSTACQYKLTLFGTYDHAIGWNELGDKSSCGNTTISDGGASEHNIKFTTPAGGPYNVTITYNGHTSCVTCTPVSCPSSNSGQTVYKFTTKSSDLETGNICENKDQDYPQTTTNALSELVGGTLAARASSANTSNLRYHNNSFDINGANGWLIVGLDCSIQEGDLIKYRYLSGSGSTVQLSLQTTKGTTTNQINLNGATATHGTIQTVEVTAAQATAFASLSTVYLVRTGSNTAYLDYFEILRPLKVTLNANTNGGKVGGEDTKNLYFATGESQLLPCATKSDYLFKGWFDASSGGDAVANPYTATTSPKTLYAQFDDCSSTAGTVYKFQLKTGLDNSSITAGDLNVGNYLSAMDGGTAVITGSHAKIVNDRAIDFNDNGDYITVNLDCELKAGDFFKTTISGSRSGIKVTTTSSTTSLKNISFGTNVETEVPASLVGKKTFRIYRQDSNCGGLSYFEITRPSGYAVTYNNGGHGTAPDNTTASSVTLTDISTGDWINTGWKANVATTVGGEAVAENTLIANGSVVTLSGATTFTAQWTECSGPSITAFSNSEGHNYNQGDAATTMSITASAGNGGALHYHWYQYNVGQDHATQSVDAAGYTDANTYTPSTASAHGQQIFYCVVSEEGCSKTITSAHSGAIAVTAAADPCSEPEKLTNEIARFFVPCNQVAGSAWNPSGVDASTDDNTFTITNNLGGSGDFGGDNWKRNATTGFKYGKMQSSTVIQLTLKSGSFRAGDVVTAYVNSNSNALQMNSGSSKAFGTQTTSSYNSEYQCSITLAADNIESDGSIKIKRSGAIFVNRIIVTREPACFEITDAKKPGSGWTDRTSSAQEITSSMLKGTISGGTVLYSGTGTLNANETYGLVFDNNNDEITITLSGTTLPAGALIVIGARGKDNTDSHQCGFVVSGNSMSPATTTSSTKGNSFTQTYTVKASDGIIGGNTFTIKRVTDKDKTYLESLYIIGCEEVSCADFSVARGGQESGTFTVGSYGGSALTCTPSPAGSYTYAWKQYPTSGMPETAVAAEGTGNNTNSFTPNPASAGTYIYFCDVTDACSTTKRTSLTGAFTFNAAPAFTASTSVNIEQFVLDNRKSKFTELKDALDAAHISCDLTAGCDLDSLDDACNKTDRNNDYLGLKIKAGDKNIQMNVPSGKTLKVRFGKRAAAVKVWIDGVAQTDIPTTGNYYTYELASSGSNRVVKIATADGNAVVIKQIMIGEEIASVTLPAKITLGGTTNGTISVASTKVNVGSTVTVTVTPESGYELETLTYTPACPDDASPVDIKTAKQFTMPNGNVTINATFTAAAPATYSITYNCDGASSGCPTDVAAATSLPSPLPSAPTKSGYTFDGWYTNSEKTVAAVAGATLTGNVILYAKWIEDTGNKVTYNGNENTSGSVPTDDTDYAAGEIVTVKGNTGNLVKTGQTFLGWNTADDYTGTFYPADYKFEMPASAVTLYAVWGTGQVCYTITDFETTTHNSSSGNPDGQGKYFYGYMGTTDTEHAVTITAPNTNNVGVNSGAYMQVYGGNSVYIYADNTTTGGTPATFSGVTSISFKIKATKNTKIPTIDVYVGTTKIGTVTGGSEASDSDGHEYDTSKFTTITFSSLSNLSGIVKFTNTNSGSSDYKALIDDIEICTGSGSSGYTVTFNNNGEGEYSRTISNVPSGSKIGEPIPDPTASGNTFAGWYKEAGCTNAWNFATETVTADKTLYAKWTNCLPTITTQPVGNTYTRGGAPVAMTIVASGDVTGYQWFSNDEDNATTGTPIDGKTTGGYTPTTDVVGTTYYYCVVSNDCGSVASDVVAIVVNDDRLTPCAAWTIDEPTHGGQGFSFSVAAKKNDCSEAWDGTLTEGMLTVSEGVILGAITVNNGTKTISGTYGVSGTAESPVTFYLSLPRTDTHSAALLSQTRDFTACEGGAEEFYWSANVSSPLTANTAAKLVSKTTDTEIELSGSTSANSSTRTTDTATGIVDGTTYSFLNSDPHHTYIKMSSGNTFHFTTTATATISIQFSTPSNDNSGIEIRQSSSSGTVVASKMITSKAGKFQTLTTGSVAAGTYYVVAVNKEMNIGEILVVQGSGSAGTETPTLGWSPSIDGNVEKNENAADFTYTATRSNDKAVASLGTISYSSSNTSVATVNAATGQVTIAGNIDFGSADHIDVTITATLSASGCYKKATNTYTLRVKKYVCTEAAGTVTVTGESGCGKVLTISGYEEGASIQWYKDGEVITGAIGTSYTATSGGTYYAITHKGCDAVSNELTISTAAATAKKIVDEWYVKKGRRTPDIALVQTTNATGFTVSVSGSPIWKSDGTETTGFAGCGFYLGEDGIIYLKGETNNGKEPAKDDGSWAAGDVTLSITATACANAAPVEITIHKQAATLNPSIAFVVDGGVGKAVTNVSPDKTSSRALWTYLTSAFDLTGCNIYWTTDEKALRQYYSQYDAILITDDPNTRQYPDGKDEKISATKGYVNAMGTLIDVRPMLTMEAYVSRLANWDCVKGTPYSPSPRDYVLKLQCKEHAIYKDMEANGTTVRHVEIDGIDHWYVTMVDASNKTYADTDDETDATGTPALQGFDGKVNAGMLGIGTIADETLQGGIERQAEPAARMMVLGINNKAMAALTDPGKKVIMNALKYLLNTDMETLEDCSNYFHGQGGTSTDWFTADNWSAGKVPDPTVRAVILAPCEIAGATPARASSVDIAVGGKTGRYKSGASDCEGHLTIAATGALVVSEGVRRIEDAPNFGVDNRKPTQTSDLYIASTSDNGNGTLIFDNPDGNTQATVGYYSRATTNEAETWNWQYMAVPFNDNSSAYRNYYDSYLYRWAENCSGWEVVPNRGAVYPWVGYTITQVGAKMYYMDGTLVETGEQTFTVPANADLVLGNSWTAPLQIKQFEDDDFDGLQKKVYLFNTGYDYNKTGTQYEDGATHYEAGTYVVVPIHSSPYTGDSLISSLQAFTVTSEGGEGTLTLDYERHVRPARSTDKVNAGPMHAPRRAAAREDKPTVLKIWASGNRFDDRLVVLEREDFSTGSDDGWDGEKVLMGEMAPTIYTVMENGYESVTATNDYEGTLIGFKAGEDNEYTFRFEYDDMAEPLFLLDMDERMYVRILTGTTYTFTCADKGEHNRFLLTRKAPGIATGCEPIDGGGGPKATKFIKDNKLYILLNGVLYDATGKVVE